MRFLLNGALCAAAFALAACNSSGGQQAPANGQEVEWIGPDGPEPYDPNITKDRRLAGDVLADVDKSLRIWVNITLTGNPAKDGSTLNIVEADLRRKVRAKLLVIVEQLETGPPINRQIAAAALGFSGDPETLSPLLAALEDDSPDVVANALLGLSVLADPDTPRILVAAELEDVNQPFNVRSQAARALRAVGLYDLGEADRAAVIRAARAALGDANEGLRPTGAIILAEVVDTNSVPELARALMDPTPLVARAASRALARIGSVDRKFEGQAARALTAALEVVDEDRVRPAVLKDLQALAGKNYGDDVEEWVRYAQKLP
jgi:HEAT repeat protein